jgi:hypothetical protein
MLDLLFKRLKKKTETGFQGLFDEIVDAQKRQQKSNQLRNPLTGEAFDPTETYNPFTDDPYRR